MLRVRDLRSSYGAVPVLMGVSIDVPEGEIVSVLGNNGAGKSTLMKAISGVLRLHGGKVDGGSINWDGTPVLGKNPAHIVRLGVVQAPEGRQIFTRLTVEENLRIGAFLNRSRSRRERSLNRVFELFPILADRRGQRAGLLSGGEQQMLAIGRALMAVPRILLLDEPSLGLAPQLVQQMANIIREINAQGTTVLLVEQNAVMALQVASSAYVLSVGSVSLSGTADALSRSAEVKRLYLGTAGNSVEDLVSRSARSAP